MENSELYLALEFVGIRCTGGVIVYFNDSGVVFCVAADVSVDSDSCVE